MLDCRSPKKNFVCDFCNASFVEKELNCLPINVSMEWLSTIAKKRRTSVKAMPSEKDEDASDFTITCSQCEEGAPATKWCLTCEDAEICDECYKIHCRLKRFKPTK